MFMYLYKFKCVCASAVDEVIFAEYLSEKNA
jgi:hypothetical protein